MKSLFEKPILDGKLRMTQPSLVFVPDIQVIAEHIVESDEICRIDLISLKYYRDSSYSDYILKYNGISNPFSINEGDVLLIPTNESATTRVIPFREVNANEDKLSIRDQFINTKRLSKKDAKRVEYLQRKAAQKINGSKEILPPNIRKSGDAPNISIGNGTITI
jgi:hypothetical protein